jgi:hypothetical protein
VHAISLHPQRDVPAIAHQQQLTRSARQPPQVFGLCNDLSRSGPRFTQQDRHGSGHGQITQLLGHACSLGPTETLAISDEN